MIRFKEAPDSLLTTPLSLSDNRHSCNKSDDRYVSYVSPPRHLRIMVSWGRVENNGLQLKVHRPLT